MRAFSSKLIGPRFKSWQGTVGDSSHYTNMGSSARLKACFELNPGTEVKQGTFPLFPFFLNIQLYRTTYSL